MIYIDHLRCLILDFGDKNKNNKNADDKPAAAAEKAARIVRNDDAEFAVHPHYRRQ